MEMEEPGVADPLQYNTHLAEGEKFETAGNFQKAIDSYTKAIEAVSPNGILSYPPAKHCFTSRSRCFLQLGDDKNALKDAEQSLKDEPTFIKGIYAKAEALYVRGDFEFALVFYHRGNKLRPELSEFRLGISKSQEAIINAIGSTETCQLKVTPEIVQVLNNGNDRPSAKPKNAQRTYSPSRHNLGSKSKQALHQRHGSDQTVKQLLGELYADQQYLESLLADPALVGTPVNEIRAVASKELKYLEKRSDFWRQQKPVYARQNEQKQKLTKSLSKSSQSPSASPAKKHDGSDSALIEEIRSGLARIDSLLDSDQAEDALQLGKSLLDQAEKLTSAEKPTLIGDVYSAIGNAALDLNDLQQALDYHTRDLNLGKTKGREEAISRGLSNVGRVYARLGQFDKAIEAWESKLHEDLSHLEKAWLHHELGRSYLELNNLTVALENGQKASIAAIQANDDRWLLNATILVAQVQKLLGKTSESTGSFNAALKLVERLDDESTKGAIHQALEELEAQAAKDASAV